VVTSKSGVVTTIKGDVDGVKDAVDRFHDRFAVTERVIVFQP
jgi:hypothetical protein